MKELAGLIPILLGLGQPAVIAAGLVIGGVVALLLFSRLRGVLLTDREGRQSAELVKSALTLIDDLRKTEADLRRRLSLAENDRDDAQDALLELRVSLDLLRGQRRRLVSYLRQYLAGTLKPEDVSALDLGGADA